MAFSLFTVVRVIADLLGCKERFGVFLPARAHPTLQVFLRAAAA